MTPLLISINLMLYTIIQNIEKKACNFVLPPLTLKSAHELLWVTYISKYVRDYIIIFRKHSFSSLQFSFRHFVFKILQNSIKLTSKKHCTLFARIGGNYHSKFSHV